MDTDEYLLSLRKRSKRKRHALVAKLFGVGVVSYALEAVTSCADRDWRRGIFYGSLTLLWAMNARAQYVLSCKADNRAVF